MSRRGLRKHGRSLAAADDDHAFAMLWNTVVGGIEYLPTDDVAVSAEASQDRSKVPAVVHEREVQHVLDDEHPRAQLREKSANLPVHDIQWILVVPRSRIRAGEALARKTRNEHVQFPALESATAQQLSAVQMADIGLDDGGLREVLPKGLACNRMQLDEPSDTEASHAEPERQAARASEQVQA